MQDINATFDQASSGQVVDHARWMEQYHQIVNDPQNPHYNGFHRGDQKTMDYIDQQYRKIFGGGQMRIGSESLSSHPINISEKSADVSPDVDMGIGEAISINTADAERAVIESLSQTDRLMYDVMTESGDDYLDERRHAGIASDVLFPGEDGQALYARLQAPVQALPAEHRLQAEIATLLYFADMGRIFSQANPR